MQTKDSWQTGLSEELYFWKEYIDTKGLRWPNNYKRKLDPYATILACVEYEILLASEPINILEVGCGPASFLGCVSTSGKAVTCVYSDALATEYQSLWVEAGIKPPHPIQAVRAEQLSNVFDTDRFAIIFARNCLDHMSDPMEALRQMLYVTRPDGAVILLHYENEGNSANFSGLHKWNLHWNEETYCLADRQGRSIDLLKELADVAVLETFLSSNGCPGDDPALQKAVFRKIQS